jgi:hypothetical protein
VEIIVKEQNCMRLSGFIEEIYTVAFGFMIPWSLKVINKDLEETITKTLSGEHTGMWIRPYVLLTH